jgi:hypothetical protein
MWTPASGNGQPIPNTPWSTTSIFGLKTVPVTPFTDTLKKMAKYTPSQTPQSKSLFRSMAAPASAVSFPRPQSMNFLSAYVKPQAPQTTQLSIRNRANSNPNMNRDVFFSAKKFPSLFKPNLIHTTPQTFASLQTLNRQVKQLTPLKEEAPKSTIIIEVVEPTPAKPSFFTPQDAAMAPDISPVGSVLPPPLFLEASQSALFQVEAEAARPAAAAADVAIRPITLSLEPVEDLPASASAGIIVETQLMATTAGLNYLTPQEIADGLHHKTASEIRRTIAATRAGMLDHSMTLSRPAVASERKRSAKIKAFATPAAAASVASSPGTPTRTLAFGQEQSFLQLSGAALSRAPAHVANADAFPPLAINPLGLNDEEFVEARDTSLPASPRSPLNQFDRALEDDDLEESNLPIHRGSAHPFSPNTRASSGNPEAVEIEFYDASDDELNISDVLPPPSRQSLEAASDGSLDSVSISPLIGAVRASPSSASARASRSSASAASAASASPRKVEPKLPVNPRFITSMALTALTAAGGYVSALMQKIDPKVGMVGFAVTTVAYKVLAKISHNVSKSNPVRSWKIQTIGHAAISGTSIYALQKLKITNPIVSIGLAALAVIQLGANMHHLQMTKRAFSRQSA